jgi:hypothetical protein
MGYVVNNGRFIPVVPGPGMGGNSRGLDALMEQHLRLHRVDSRAALMSLYIAANDAEPVCAELSHEARSSFSNKSGV